MRQAAQPQPAYPAYTPTRSPSPLSATRLLSSHFLSPEERQGLIDIALPERTFKAHVDLVSEGADADSVFVVVDGWMCRYVTTRDGRRQLPAILLPGDIGNLDTVMFDRPDYGLRTLTAATVVPLPRQKLLALATHYPGIACTLTWLAMVENVALSKWVLSLGRKAAPERMAHLLCELSARLDPQSTEISSFALPLTQEVLGDALGLTCVHVNRTMQHLRSEGLVVTKGRVMTLPDLAKIRRLGGFHPRYLHLTCSPMPASGGGVPRGAGHLAANAFYASATHEA